MCPKDADGMANGEEVDQIALLEAVRAQLFKTNDVKVSLKFRMLSENMPIFFV